MRLLSKIVGVVLLGIIVLLAIDAYLSVRREIALFDRDMAHDATLIGRTLQPLVARAWAEGGDVAASGIISEASREEGEIDIRWVRLGEGQPSRWAPRVDPALLDSLSNEAEISIKSNDGPDGYRYTYVVVPVADGRGAVELSEPLAVLHAYTRNTVFRKGLLIAVLVAVSWLMLWALGIRYVGSPLERLVEKTHRVGKGDFSGDVLIAGRDELAHLADSMNDMCRELEAAQQAIRKETEAREEALDQLRHSERLAMLGRMSSGIAHELGTPLNVVAGRANLIATESLSHDDVVAYSNTIAEQARRMTDIIRQLLGFAHRRPSQREPSDVSQLAQQIVDLLAPTAAKSEVSIEFIKADGLPELMVDRSHIQQVLMNLLMNGIHAMPDGGRITVEVGTAWSRHRGVSTGPERDFITVRVEDEGVGIPMDEIDSVFEPFFTTKESGKGTGLGLSIAYGIVEEHDGWIDVQSELGKGSRFTVYLPIGVTS